MRQMQEQQEKMKKTLKDLFGTETGYNYPDGSPVLIGDRVKMEGIEYVGTVHVRINKKLYYYVTYCNGSQSFSRPLSRVVESGRFRKDLTPRHSNGKPIKPVAPPKLETVTAKRHVDKDGDYILCIEDFDNAIYGTIK